MKSSILLTPFLSRSSVIQVHDLPLQWQCFTQIGSTHRSSFHLPLPSFQKIATAIVAIAWEILVQTVYVAYFWLPMFIQMSLHCPFTPYPQKLKRCQWNGKSYNRLIVLSRYALDIHMACLLHMFRSQWINSKIRMDRILNVLCHYIQFSTLRL